MLPKLKVHFGSEILEVPQITMIKNITGPSNGETLKECLLERYKNRTAAVLKEKGQNIDAYYVTDAEAELQLVEDLKTKGSDFVFETAWKDGYMEVFHSLQAHKDEWCGFEEEPFKGIIEKKELPKLKIHFGSKILEVPQTKALRVITMGGKGDTLKDNIVDLYRLRVAHILKESGQDYNYDNITPEEVEAQLLKDLKEFGSDFVIKQAWDSGYTEVFGDGSYTNDSCISNEDEEYEGIVEHFVEEKDNGFRDTDEIDF